jgi:ribosomal protein L29
MAETETEPVAPTMTVEQTEAYREELKKELFDLEHAQSLFFSEYKADRINRMKQRLGIPVD